MEAMALGVPEAPAGACTGLTDLKSACTGFTDLKGAAAPAAPAATFGFLDARSGATLAAGGPCPPPMCATALDGLGADWAPRAWAAIDVSSTQSMCAFMCQLLGCKGSLDVRASRPN
jgi:hypothetical protein